MAHELTDKNRWKGGRGRRRYLTLADIAAAKGVSVGAVRKAVSRGALDPADPRSLCRYLKEEGEDRKR